jgi:ChpA-C
VQMKTRVAGVLAATACAMAMMGGPAFAYAPHHQHGPVNSGNTSIGSGNNVDTPISVPVNICGTAIAILGFADASCVGGASVFFSDFGNFNTFSSTPAFP